MPADHRKTIEAIFHAALERAPEERDRFLDSACGNDPELRRDVESLLEEASQTEIFMELPFATYRDTALDFTTPKSLTGLELNHYRIGPLVGAGGAAEVYRARDTRLHRDVAIKVLHSAHLFDRECLERFHREAQILALVSHPNIASVYGFEEANGLWALVLELVEGETLAERITQHPLAPETALNVAMQIAAALDAAHSKGVIHRDLKPSNIKLTRAGTVKVLDFGIAKLLQRPDDYSEAMTRISRDNAVLGTVAYMSPEQARGKAMDTRTDIWAFGCLLYESVTGTPAFAGETPADIIVKIATEEPDWTRLPTVPRRLLSELERIIRKCLQKAPESRYQSMRELAADLDCIRQDWTGTRPASGGPTQPPEAEFVLPTKSARSLFLVVQIGYLVLYGAAMYHIESISRILVSDFRFPGDIAITAMILLGMSGVAVRIYLISGVGWRHPTAGQKFHRLFPVLLVLDGIWAASPLLVWQHIGYGVAFTFVAMLAYVPFAERTLVRSIYPKTSVRGFSRLFETK